jgi:thymidylate kinase
MSINKFLIEGLDRLGKDTLIDGIMHQRGYHQVLHFSKPRHLARYMPSPTGMTAAEMESVSFKEYQEQSFRTMFAMLRNLPYTQIICNRAHLGECVYAPLYRGYAGEYVFDIEKQFLKGDSRTIRLILLTEDFSVSKHFVDDGESFDIAKREQEQDLFKAAFEKSCISDKRIVNVTDRETGGYRSKQDILLEVTSL